jgi:hypothetical protein
MSNNIFDLREFERHLGRVMRGGDGITDVFPRELTRQPRTAAEVRKGSHVIGYGGAMRPRIPRPLTITWWQRIKRATRRIFSSNYR